MAYLGLKSTFSGMRRSLTATGTVPRNGRFGYDRSREQTHAAMAMLPVMVVLLTKPACYFPLELPNRWLLKTFPSH